MRGVTSYAPPSDSGKRPLSLQGRGPRRDPWWQHRPRPHPPWSQMASLASHIRLSLTTSESPVLPLFAVPTSFCLSLHFSTTHLFLLVAPIDSECMRSSQQGYAQPCITAPARGYLRHGLPPPRPPWCRLFRHNLMYWLVVYDLSPMEW